MAKGGSAAMPNGGSPARPFSVGLSAGTPNLTGGFSPTRPKSSFGPSGSCTSALGTGFESAGVGLTIGSSGSAGSVGFFSLRSLSTTGGGGLGVGCFTTGFFGGGVAGLTTDACFVGAPSDKRSADASFSDPLGQREKANQPIAERPEKISKTASQAIRNDLPRPE